MSAPLRRDSPAEGRVLDRLLDGLVLGFALWTLLCHAVVLIGGTLRQLIGAACAVALVALLALLRRTATPSPAAALLPAPSAVPDPARTSLPRIAVFLGALAATGLYVAFADLRTFWLVGAATLLLSFAFSITSDPRFETPIDRLSWTTLLALISAICALFVLLVHRPNIDDSVYVNLAVTAVDAPDQPIFASDGLHGLPEFPESIQYFKVTSIELLQGSLAYLTGLHALDFAHVIGPAVVALLSPLAWARFLRLLLPRSWIWGVAVVALFFLFTPGTTYGGFSFIRLQHGKAILGSLALPLLMTYGLEFASSPTAKRWLRLMAVQIATVGLTSTALWVAPITSGLALLCGTSIRRYPVRTLFQGLAASAYVLGVAIFLKVNLDGGIAPTNTKDSIALMSEALHRAFGRPLGLYLALFVVLGAWTLARSPLQRRFASVFPLGFLMMWSPFWARWLADSVTHQWTYWRVAWVLPFPVLLALMLTWATELRTRRNVLAASWRPLALIFLLAILCLGTTIFSGQRFYRRTHSNGSTQFRAPTWKVPLRAFAVACAVEESSEPGAAVLAPDTVSPWLTTLHSHPYPLVVRPVLLQSQVNAFGRRQVHERMLLFRLVSGEDVAPRANRLLLRAHEEYSLSTVALVRAAKIEWRTYREVLRAARFRRALQTPHFEVWTKHWSGRELPGRKRGRSCRGLFSPIGEDVDLSIAGSG